VHVTATDVCKDDMQWNPTSVRH